VKVINSILKNIDLYSLRFRLTVGVAAVSVVGLGSLATWTGWKIEQILIDSGKHNVEQISARLPRDTEIYMEMISPDSSLQRAINNLTNDNTFLLVKSPEQKILAKSTTWNLLPDVTASKLMNNSYKAIKPHVYQVKGRYFVLCGSTVEIQGRKLGDVAIAQDITYEQTMFVGMMRGLSAMSVVVIVMMGFAIAFYIKRALEPLRDLNQMAGVISTQDLGEAQLSISNAPSEVKELAQTFNMMLSRLSQSWEQERQFVSNVSHELRTPLTIVQGYLQSVLRRQNNLTEPQIEALETAASEAERTIRLLEDLLELARVDNGNLHFHIENCQLNDLVGEIVGMAIVYSQREILVESPYPIAAKVDCNRLKQVLLNLIDNAVKYSPADKPVVLRLMQQGETAIIQVCDNGYGIALQYQTRIFERFYRVDEARNRAGGTGLGLSIVKTVVEGMGGTVAVRSRLGEGSVFTVSLPCF
jgi:signal transduction histidine kinase